jgi:putative transposase
MPVSASGCGARWDAPPPPVPPSARVKRSRRPQGGPPRKPPPSGYDGGKKVKGRKRHLLVATHGLVRKGLVRKGLVHAADVPDRDGGRLLLEALQTPQPVSVQFPRLSHLWGDAGYRGRFVTWVRASLGWSVAVVKDGWTGVSTVWVFPGQEPPETPTGFQLLKWRWSVERTFAWIGCSRRMSKSSPENPPVSPLRQQGRATG